MLSTALQRREHLAAMCMRARNPGECQSIGCMPFVIWCNTMSRYATCQRCR